jgi:hypothetical protein
MNPQRPGRTRRSVTGALTKVALVGIYLTGVLGISSLTMTTGSAPALAKAKKKSGGSGKHSGGRRGGRRGRRGRGGCSIALQVLDLC